MTVAEAIVSKSSQYSISLYILFLQVFEYNLNVEN